MVFVSQVVTDNDQQRGRNPNKISSSFEHRCVLDVTQQQAQPGSGRAIGQPENEIRLIACESVREKSANRTSPVHVNERRSTSLTHEEESVIEKKRVGQRWLLE